MKIETTILIAKPINNVWAVFVDPSTWAVWYGGVLKKVEPDWQTDARLEWGLGSPSRVGEFITMESVTIISSDKVKVSYGFTDLKDGTTSVRVEKDFTDSRLSVTDPGAVRHGLNLELMGLKKYAETNIDSSEVRDSANVSLNQENAGLASSFVNARPPLVVLIKVPETTLGHTEEYPVQETYQEKVVVKPGWLFRKAITEMKTKTRTVMKIRIVTETVAEQSVRMEFCYIPPGSYIMGDRDETGCDVHPVVLTKEFYLGKYPVTQDQWQAIMGYNPSHFKGKDFPMEMVSWEDCQKFIDKLNHMGGPFTYRLPTEAEWEYACRAGSTTAYCFGSETSRLGEYAWYKANSDSTTHSVGQKSPNAWGVSDMHGNVWEWCHDWAGAYPQTLVTDPEGPKSGTPRVIRGGNFAADALQCRSAYRHGNWPDARGRNRSIGFRLVCLRAAEPADGKSAARAVIEKTQTEKFEESLRRLGAYLGQDYEKIVNELGEPSEILTNDSGTKFLYYTASKALFTISGDSGKASYLSAPMANAAGMPLRDSVSSCLYEDIAPNISKEELEKRWGIPDSKAIVVWTYSKHGGTTLDGRGFDLAVNFMGYLELRWRKDARP